MGYPLNKRIEFGIRRLIIRLLQLKIPDRLNYSILPAYHSSKYLFLRFDKIGDALVSTPVIEEFKKCYPNAIVDMLLSESNNVIFKFNPFVRRCLIFDKNIFSFIRLIKYLRNAKYDYVIDLMDKPSTTSAVICSLIKAKWTVGFRHDAGFPYDIAVTPLSRSDYHIVERTLKILEPLGIKRSEIKDIRLRYFSGEEADKYADKYYASINTTNILVIAINISAGSESRFWGIENYIQFIKLLYTNNPKYRIVLFVVKSDIQKARRIASFFDNILIAPIESLYERYAALLHRASVIITPDTSTVHLADAFGVPSVVMFPAMSKDGGKLWEPYRSIHQTVVSPSNELSSLSPHMVFAAFKVLIERLKSE